MNLTYTWKLSGLRKATSDTVKDAVVQTHWTLTGTDADGNEGVFNGATPFPLSEVDPANFTPYEALTEDQVLGWIKAIVVGPYWDHVEQQIVKQIEAKRVTVEEVSQDSLPWANP